MRAVEFNIFETAIGWCAIAWTERGIVRARLPEADAEATRARILKRFPEAQETEPQGEIARVVVAIKALLAGARVDLSWVPLDLEGAAPFNVRVWDIARAIPAGATLTYGEVAERLGDPTAARAVGQALGGIRFRLSCRATAFSPPAEIGGFSAPGGLQTKARLLTIEGAQTSAAPSLFDRLPLSAPPRKA